MKGCKICGQPKYHSYAVCAKHFKDRKNANKKRLEEVKKKLDESYGFSKTKAFKKQPDMEESFWDINGTAIYC